ncbi:MAG: PRC-barrel domain-containing protein [Clostridiales bacterium]|nr:PRC-barrel domain-containing protein [Clostridiales bacterium]
MTSLKRLIGLPVILDGRTVGHVLRGVLTTDGQQLRGLVIRGGLRGARWLPAARITLLGRVSVIGEGSTDKLPRDTAFRLFRVSDADGTRLGVVSDAMLHEDTLRVLALEISAGPVDDLISGRFFATAFAVRPADGGETGHVTIPGEVT